MKAIHMFLSTLVMSCIFTACNPTEHNGQNTYGVNKVTSVKNMSIDTLNVKLLDSLTKADNLPLYSKWVKSYFKDDETRTAYEYATIVDNTTGVIYTVKFLKNKNVYVVLKRKTTNK